MRDTHAQAPPRPLLLGQLVWPLVGTALFVLAPRLPLALSEDWRRLLETGAWLLGAWLVIRLLNLLVWERWVPRWLGVRPPGLLRQFVAVLVAIFALALVLSRTWGLALSAVLATTGLLGIVMGLALRNIVADFFSGIALNIEKPFDLGDFVLLRVRGQRDPFAGTVREINWRSTRLLTPEDNLVSVPNSVVALSVIENLSYPSPVSEQELDITLDWDVPQAHAERVLSAAVTEAWALGATAGDRPPKLRLCKLDGNGVSWRVVYLLDPRLRGKAAARHTVLACMHRHLNLVGLRPAAPAALAAPALPAQAPTLRAHEQVADRSRVMAEVTLLRSLSDAERLQLAGGAQVRLLGEGVAVVTAGEQGQTLFVVAEGVLEVCLDTGEGRRRVNVLAPGSAFGELALFTGEPRSATVRTLCPTVLYEIHRDQLLPLLTSRPSLVDELSLAVAQYQARDRRTMEQVLSEGVPAPAQPGLVRQLATRIRSWLA